MFCQEYEAYSGKDDALNNFKFVSFLGFTLRSETGLTCGRPEPPKGLCLAEAVAVALRSLRRDLALRGDYTERQLSIRPKPESPCFRNTGSSVLDETSAEYFGWGNDGTPGATLAFAGLRDQAAQSPRKDPLSSWTMYTGGFEAKPDFGAGIHTFFASGRMPVTIGCKSDGTWGDNNTDDCALHEIKVFFYQLDLPWPWPLTLTPTPTLAPTLTPTLAPTLSNPNPSPNPNPSSSPNPNQTLP